MPWQIMFVKSMIGLVFLFSSGSLSLPFSHPSLYHVTSRLVITAYGTGIYKWGKKLPDDQLAPPSPSGGL